MRQFLLFLFAFFFLVKGNAQILEAKVYDNTATVKGIKVINKTQNSVTTTDEEGNFLLIAKVSDTITFESLFHHPKNVVLKAYHFKDETVFELKKIVNELDEVEIKERAKELTFNKETYNKELQSLIKEDMKRNPGLYAPAGATYGVDLFALIDMVVKLFKRKDKYKAPVYQPVTYEQLDSLNRNSSFFNDRLFQDDLKIPEDKKALFLEFCSAKQISSELLKEKNKMTLLEELVVNSQLFLILLDEYGKANATKD